VEHFALKVAAYFCSSNVVHIIDSQRDIGDAKAKSVSIPIQTQQSSKMGYIQVHGLPHPVVEANICMPCKPIGRL
jgi:hypothetical protein